MRDSAGLENDDPSGGSSVTVGGDDVAVRVAHGQIGLGFGVPRGIVERDGVRLVRAPSICRERTRRRPLLLLSSCAKPLAMNGSKSIEAWIMNKSKRAMPSG